MTGLSAQRSGQRISLDYGSMSQISAYADEGEHFPQLRSTNQFRVSVS
jgi:hypothetical protein